MASYLSPYLLSLPPTCVPSPGAKLSAQAPLSLSRNAADDAPHFRRVARTCARGAGSDIPPHLWLSRHDLLLCFIPWLVIVVLFLLLFLWNDGASLPFFKTLCSGGVRFFGFRSKEQLNSPVLVSWKWKNGWAVKFHRSNCYWTDLTNPIWPPKAPFVIINF